MESSSLAAGARATLALAVVVTAASSCTDPAAIDGTPKEESFTILAPATDFTNPGFTLIPGEPITIRASGTWVADPTIPPVGPDGDTTFGDCDTCILPGRNNAYGLIARVGTGDWQYIGAGPKTITGSGQVVFASNDAVGGQDDNSGALILTISYTCWPKLASDDKSHYHCGAQAGR